MRLGIIVGKGDVQDPPSGAAREEVRGQGRPEINSGRLIAEYLVVISRGNDRQAYAAGERSQSARFVD